MQRHKRPGRHGLCARPTWNCGWAPGHMPRGYDHCCVAHMATSEKSAVSLLHSGFIPPVALDFGSDTPLYRQISVWLERAILCCVGTRHRRTRDLRRNAHQGDVHGAEARFAMIPPDLVESLLDLRNATDTVSTPTLHQMAMTDFIREGHFSRHIKRMRAVYMERRNAMTRAIRDEAGGLLEVAGDDAGLCVLALLPCLYEAAAGPDFAAERDGSSCSAHCSDGEAEYPAQIDPLGARGRDAPDQLRWHRGHAPARASDRGSTAFSSRPGWHA